MVQSKSTLSDIAKLAKVSIKTASRVVRKESKVSPKTRAAVEDAIKILNYRPSVAPRAAVGSKSYVIGLVFDNPNASYIVELLQGALEQARKDGYHLIVEPVNLSSPSIIEDINNLLIQSNLDGMILPPPLCDEPSILKTLISAGKPFVRISPSISDELGLRVEINDHDAAKNMTNKLITLGHKSIGFVTGRKGTATTRRRLAGFYAAMKDARLAVPNEFVLEGNFEYKSALIAGEQLLNQEKRPTAIFASNDEMAAGLIAAAHKAGLSVPGDLSIAGFDDSMVATVVWPQLTTVRQPIKDMAATAVRILIEQCRAEKDYNPSNELLSTEIITRGSTAAKEGN
ncbi:MAG: Catabolite control protein A [Cellvibrionales bacterium UBA7375]|nr:transcriptional regulator [Gammaproteobacteria bacterium]CAI8157990.1 MAG: Catabolite control protein A [Cellvibrionales bacterium UBA7375]